MMFYRKKNQSIMLKLLCIAAAFFILLSACDLISPSGGSDGDSEPQEETLFGTYDSWTYVSGSGWTMVPNNQLVIGTASLKLSGSTIFPTTGATAQQLGIKDGQIWIKVTANNSTQTVYCLDYFLQDATAYGTKILWIKSDTTTTATLTVAPEPATATANSILCFIPVGSTPSETPPAKKSLYAFGMAGSSVSDFDAYYWKDNVPTKLAKPTGANRVFALAMQVVGSDTYITGTSSDRVYDGFWKNGVWQSLPGFKYNYGEGNFSATNALFTESDIYLVGRKYENDTNSSPFEGGYYHNGLWHKLESRTVSDKTMPMSIAIDKGDVYIVGICFDPSITNSNRACYWKNDTLVLLGEITGQKESDATNISIYGSDIRISGTIKKSDNSYIAGWWKNGTWSRNIKTSTVRPVTSNIIKTADSIYCGYTVMDMTAMEAGYSFYDVSTSSYVNKVLANLATSYPFLASLAIDGSDIYVSGAYVDFSSQQYLGGYWKNTEWNAIALPDNSFTQSLVCSIMLM